MKRHVLSIHHYVTQLEEAIVFCTSFLAFQLLEQASSYAVIDNGSLRIRLIQLEQDSQLQPTKLVLNLPTKHIEREEAAYQQKPFLTQIKPLHHVSPERAESHFQGKQGFTLVLSRTYNEDELGILPELDTNLCWEEEA